MLEEHFIRGMIRADGEFLVFFERPIAGTLGVLVLLVVLLPLLRRFVRSPA
jgi:TctA family transporter